MPILTIKHVTTYHYRQPVAFGEHRMMLRPRDDNDQKVLRSRIAISPEPRSIDWTRDDFGNHVATASFSERATELRFDSTHCVDTPRPVPSGRHRRVCAVVSVRLCGRRDARPRSLPRAAAAPRVRPLGRRLPRDDGTADTHALLVGITEHIRRTFRHGARHQKGTRDPSRPWRLRAEAAAIWRW